MKNITFFVVIPCIGRYCASLNNGFTDNVDFTLSGSKTTLSHNGGDTITLYGHGFGHDGYYTYSLESLYIGSAIQLYRGL